MSKQEKIREGIRIYTGHTCQYPKHPCESYLDDFNFCGSSEDAYKCLMKRLGEIGVVIEVERELPYYCVCEDVYKPITMPQPAEKDFSHSNECFLYNEGFKAGYVAVEPLIEEVQSSK